MEWRAGSVREPDFLPGGGPGTDRMGCPVLDHAAWCGAGCRAAGQRRGRRTWTINQQPITNTNTNTNMPEERRKDVGKAVRMWTWTWTWTWTRVRAEWAEEGAGGRTNRHRQMGARGTL